MDSTQKSHMFKVEISDVWSLSLTFTKTITIPFAPFMGMELYDVNDQNEWIRISIDSNEFHRSRITYDIRNGIFQIQIFRMIVPYPSRRYFDNSVRLMKTLGWQTDATQSDIEIFVLNRQMSNGYFLRQ